MPVIFSECVIFSSCPAAVTSSSHHSISFFLLLSSHVHLVFVGPFFYSLTTMALLPFYVPRHLLLVALPPSRPVWKENIELAWAGLDEKLRKSLSTMVAPANETF